MAWDDRFKAASAGRAKAAKGNAAPKRMVDAETVVQARRTSPEPFLRRHYRDVVVDRRGNISVPQALRLDFLDDHWVACDWQGGPVGDNIALVRWLQPAPGFPEAVWL